MRSKRTLFSISNKKGFTLIELLMVIAILGVLSTIALKTVQEEAKKANDTQAVSMMRNLLTAMETQTPPTGSTYWGGNFDILQWEDEPPIQIGKNLYVDISEDADGRWQVYGAHKGGKLGYYFWVPNEVCSEQVDDGTIDSDGTATPADRIVPSAGEASKYVYTFFRGEAFGLP
jgi:prepilin-type N-terminal cleavage/methylation domain-containing protein